MTFYTTDPSWIIFLWLSLACAEPRLAQSNGHEIYEQSLKIKMKSESIFLSSWEEQALRLQST